MTRRVSNEQKFAMLFAVLDQLKERSEFGLANIDWKRIYDEVGNNEDPNMKISTLKNRWNTLQRERDVLTGVVVKEKRKKTGPPRGSSVGGGSGSASAKKRGWEEEVMVEGVGYARVEEEDDDDEATSEALALDHAFDKRSAFAVPWTLQPFNAVFVGIAAARVTVAAGIVEVVRALSLSAKAAVVEVFAADEVLVVLALVGRSVLVNVSISRMCSSKGDERTHGREANNAKSKSCGRTIMAHEERL
ncbi:hypothetical protein G7Y89_g7310 [Cudoniella acicularis]|uniref:Uncharacterized protein n=1 Tax=Cudoniella acicularis TaxID=354080 RepID=A0A8H4W4P3_9HELO|nr:hypothetical protein G7Y89_g7310 [Cudoniella acicularis]